MNEFAVETFNRLSSVNDLYLNAIRNAFILLTLGLALYGFEPRWSRLSLILILVAIFFLAIVVVNYYIIGARTAFMDMTILGIVVLIVVLFWLIWQAYADTNSQTP